MLGEDPRPQRLGQVQVVAVEGVLGLVAAAHHAPAALPAAPALGPGPAEVGVGNPLLRLTQKQPDRRGGVGVLDPEVAGDGGQHTVGRAVGGGLGPAQHAQRLVVVRRQLPAPVGDVAPLRIGEEGVVRLEENRGVPQGAAPDPGEGEDERLAEKVDALDAAHPQRRHPQEPSQVPVAVGVVVRPEASPRLEDPDPVALLRQAEGGDAAAEPAADDQNVEVLRLLAGHVPPGSARTLLPPGAGRTAEVLPPARGVVTSVPVAVPPEAAGWCRSPGGEHGGQAQLG